MLPFGKSLNLPRQCCKCNFKPTYSDHVRERPLFSSLGFLNSSEDTEGLTFVGVKRRWDVSSLVSQQQGRPMIATSEQTFDVLFCDSCVAEIDAAVRTVWRLWVAEVIIWLLCGLVALINGEKARSMMSPEMGALTILGMFGALFGLPATIAFGVVAYNYRQIRLRRIVRSDVAGNICFTNEEYQRAFEALNSRE